MIKKVKSIFLKSVKTRRINVFLLFFVLSFTILLLTKLSKDYTKTLTFKIVPSNIPDEQVIINDSTNLIQVSVETHGFNLIRYYISKPELSIDFYDDINKDDTIYYWTKNRYYSKINQQFNKDLKIKNISPDTLLFRFDVNQIKYVPVHLDANISFSPGYDLANTFLIRPDSVKIIGPSSLVNTIDSLVTQPLSLENIKTNISSQVDLINPKNQDLKVSEENVLIEGVVERFTEGTLQIPINLVNVPEGESLKIFPKNINVSYYVSLNNFKSITKDLFRVECDFSKLNEGQTFLIPEITKKPSKVKNVKINQQRIEFIIAE